eukprot:PhF_6_TR13998/c0_g1_i1/m.22450
MSSSSTLGLGPLAAGGSQYSEDFTLADDQLAANKVGSLRMSPALLAENTLLDDTLSVFSDFTIGDINPVESSCHSPVASHINRGVRSVSFFGDTNSHIRRSKGAAGGAGYFSASLYAKLEQLNARKSDSLIRSSLTSQPSSPSRVQRVSITGGRPRSSSRISK